MAYIGNPPITGNFQVCDAISVVNGQAAYTMQVSSANVTPESANHMLVSLNGVLQKPNSSFTISGSTITFASNLATGDVIDFIMLLGNVLDLGVPSDATVTDAKANFVSTSSAAGLQIKGDGTTDGTLQLNCSQNSHGVKIKSPAHSAGQSYTLTLPATAPATDKILQTNSSGVLSFVDAPSGAHALLSTTTVTSGVSSIDITANIDSTYKKYMIDILNLHPASDGQAVRLRFYQSGSFVTGSVYGSIQRWHTQGQQSFYTTQDGGTTMQALDDIGNEDYEHANARFFLNDPSNTTFRTTIGGIGQSLRSNAEILTHEFAGVIQNTTAVTGFQIYMGSGNIDNAIVKLYGIS
jgi:hypothetical protein